MAGRCCVREHTLYHVLCKGTHSILSIAYFRAYKHIGQGATKCVKRAATYVKRVATCVKCVATYVWWCNNLVWCGNLVSGQA